MAVGSDAYPYYISEILPNRVIGLYAPDSRFDDSHPREGGSQKVDAFDSTHASELYVRRCYGHWWKVSKDGKKRLSRFDSKYERFYIGYARSYQDPSF